MYLIRAWFQKISISPPWKVTGNSEGEGEGGGGSQKPKFLKESMKLKWNFQRGGDGRGWAGLVVSKA